MNLKVLKQIRQPSLSLLNKTVNTIRGLYQTHIDESFDIYLNFLRIYARSYKYKMFDPFQIEDMRMSLHKEESVWIRTRRGGKTKDLSTLAVFWTIVGKSVLWFAPTSDQLQQCKEYFGWNPFVTDLKNYKIDVFNSGIVEVTMLSKFRTRSKGTDILIFDEGGSIDINLQQFEYYEAARPIHASALWEGDKHIVHASTLWQNSAIEKEYNTMLEKDPNAVSVHPYTDCWWITEDWVESERQRHLNDPWFVDAEYRCIISARGGACFDANRIRIEDMDVLLSHNLNRFGVDINRREMVVGLFIDEFKENCYVLFEREFNWVVDQDCFNELRQDYTFIKGRRVHINIDTLIELEDLGYNEKEARVVASQIGAITQKWNEEVSGSKLALARSMIIHINPTLTPNVYNDIKTAIFHPVKKTYLKDTRHPCHWLDAFLHAIDPEKGSFIGTLEPTEMKTQSPYINRLIKEQKQRRNSIYR